MRKTLVNIGLLCFSILVFFLFGEILARMFYKPSKQSFNLENKKASVLTDQYDPLIGWVLRPGVHALHRMPGYSVEYQINSKGLRNQKVYDYEKPKGKSRIVLLGDSFTFGHGIEEEQRYGNILEKKLDNTEVINMGNSGYSTAQEYLLLKNEGLKYRPDLVIIGYYITNIRRNLNSEGYPRFKLINDTLSLINFPIPKSDSGLVVSDEIENHSLPKNVFERHSLFSAFLSEKLAYFQDRLNPLPQYEDQEEGWILLKSLLLEIKKIDSAQGAKTMIVLIPHYSYYSGKLSRFVSQKPFEQIRKFIKENNLLFLDLFPLFEKYCENHSFNDIIIEGDGHWNPLANKMAADDFYKYILLNDLVANEKDWLKGML